MVDLFHEKTQTAGRPRGHIVAEYPYHDEAGLHLYDVVRYADPKDFRARAPNGARSVKNGRRVLYRLPQLMKGVEAGRVVFLCEGEKDVDTLRQHGLVATTSPFGAGKWQAEYSEYLRDARVVLLPHNDVAGRDHAADVARQLAGIAKEIRVLVLPEVPEKGDVTDYMAQGGTVQGLKDLARSAIPLSSCSTGNKVDETKGKDLIPLNSCSLGETEDVEAMLGEAWEMRAKPALSNAAFAGPIGEVVSICAPQCEGSPVSILLPALAMYGCMVGRRAVQDIGGTHHFLNVFGLLVGDSGEGRKGTGNGVAHRVMGLVDPRFIHDNVKGGLSSGEGLIGHIADQKDKDGEIVPRDTRLHISEEEAGAVFTRMKRDGNSLSPVLRQAWDSRTLATLTRKDDGGLIAREPLVSAIMMITPDELRHGLADVELVNGFMNRFLLAYTERVSMLPFGSPVDPQLLCRPVSCLQDSLGKLPTTGALELGWTKDAHELYGAEIYPSLRPLPGRLAAMTARGAPIIRRLAGVYCVSRGDSLLSVEDLNAAKAVWDYSMETVSFIYGGTAFSPLAEKMIAAIGEVAESGLALTELRDRVTGGRHIEKPVWNAAIRELQISRQVVAEREQTSGRTRTRFFLYKGINKGKKGSVTDLIPLNYPVLGKHPAVSTLRLNGDPPAMAAADEPRRARMVI